MPTSVAPAKAGGPFLRVHSVRQCAAERWAPAFAGATKGGPAVSAQAAGRSLRLALRLALFSWPQAAMMSRPRGVRTGLA